MYLVEREVRRSGRFERELRELADASITHLVVAYERYLRRGWMPPTETFVEAASDKRRLYIVHTERAFACPAVIMVIDIPASEEPITLHAIRLRVFGSHAN